MVAKFVVEGKHFTALVTTNQCAPHIVEVYDESGTHIGTGAKSIFESLYQCVVKVVAESQR